MMKNLISTVLAAGMLMGALSFGSVSTAEEIPFLQKDNVIAVYDEDGGFYKGMTPGTTAADFLAEFESGHTLKDAKGNDVPEDKPVGTDYTVNFGEQSRRIVIYGDVNCDAKMNIADVSSILRKIASWDVQINADAADVTLDGNVNLSDVTLMLKKIAGWDVECGFVSWKYDLSKVDAPAEDTELELTFVHSAIKENYDVAKPNGKYSFDMYMAKNEYEACHVNLYSKTGHEGLSASVTPFTNKAGDVLETELFFEDYFVADTGEAYPDRLPPIEVKNGFDIDPETTQGLFLKVKSDFDTAPGMYRARVDIKDASKNTIKRAYVYTCVWDFEIPEESSVKTAYGMGSYSIYSTHQIGEDPEFELYTKYYEYFLENRITPWCLPFKPTDERADKYMSDPRVSTFLVYGGYEGDVYGNSMIIDEDTDDYLAEAYEKIEKNEEWSDKALFYMNDEPRFGDQLKAVENVKNYLDVHYPDARIIVPTHVNYFADGDGSDVNTGYNMYAGEGAYPEYAGMDTFAIIEKFTTVLCPSVRLFTTPDMDFDGVLWYTDRATETFGTLTSRLDKARDNGKEIWWYYAGDDSTAFPHSGMVHRTAYWQQYDYDIEGVLCWATTEWGGISNRPQTQRPVSRSAGLYVYNGKMFGIDGPVACLRTEIMRDGMEDIEYLVLAEKLLGKDVADEYNHKITTDMVTFEKDAYVLEAVRRELGCAIEAALADK